jgi:acyl-CoA thioesterase I
MAGDWKAGWFRYALGAGLWLGASVIGADAADINVVALGASNTAGYGVGTDAAYPAQLERLLRAKGYDVTVANAGVSGETSAQILGRVDSVVTPGTKVVVLQIFYGNDERHGVSRAETDANTQAAIARISAHGAKVVLAGPTVATTILQSHHQYDGIHLTDEGHALLAARILPQVLQAIGKAR